MDKLLKNFHRNNRKIIAHNFKNQETYINGILEELGEKILDAHKTNNNGTPDENLQAALNNDIRDCFLRGLKTDIEFRLQGINNFKDTVTNTIWINGDLNCLYQTKVHGFNKKKIILIEINNFKILHQIIES